MWRLTDIRTLISEGGIRGHMATIAAANRQVQTLSKDKLLTKIRAAERLSISTRTLDRMVAQGLVEKIFVGRSVGFRESDIELIVARGV